MLNFVKTLTFDFAMTVWRAFLQRGLRICQFLVIFDDFDPHHVEKWYFLTLLGTQNHTFWSPKCIFD